MKMKKTKVKPIDDLPAIPTTPEPSKEVLKDEIIKPETKKDDWDYR